MMAAEIAEARYIFLNCRCTEPMAIRIDTIDHGLLAGWKCPACCQSLMLSDMARASEWLRAHPEMPSVTRHPVRTEEEPHG